LKDYYNVTIKTSAKLIRPKPVTDRDPKKGKKFANKEM
jgi:hypothetical protein